MQLVLTVTDRTGRIIYRTVVKVKGSYRDRTKTNADTPTGNYKILEWRRTGNNTNYNISSYGPNDLLALDYQKGEAEGKRNGIHVHGGEKGTDKQSLKGTYGCIRISNDDIKELKELTESLEATDPKEKKGYLTVANDLDEDIDYSDREQIKNDWVRDAGFLSPITVTGNRTERKNNDDSNVNLFQKIWNSFLSILSTSR